jgi:hypothetical protein
VEVVRAGFAVLVEPDFVEVGELMIVTGHHCEVLDHSRLVGDDLNICGSPLTEHTDLDWFAGPQVAGPGKLRTHEQGSIVAGVGDRDGILQPRFAAHHVHGNEAPSYETS